MLPLPEDLQKSKNSIEEFENITLRVLEYIPNVLNDFKEKNGYKIHSSLIAGTTKYIRPINQRLFIYSPVSFKYKFNEFKEVVNSHPERNQRMKTVIHEHIEYSQYVNNTPRSVTTEHPSQKGIKRGK